MVLRDSASRFVNPAMNNTNYHANQNNSSPNGDNSANPDAEPSPYGGNNSYGNTPIGV